MDFSCSPVANRSPIGDWSLTDCRLVCNWKMVALVARRLHWLQLFSVARQLPTSSSACVTGASYKVFEYWIFCYSHYEFLAWDVCDCMCRRSMLPFLKWLNWFIRNTCIPLRQRGPVNVPDREDKLLLYIKLRNTTKFKVLNISNSLKDLVGRLCVQPRAWNAQYFITHCSSINQCLGFLLKKKEFGKK